MFIRFLCAVGLAAVTLPVAVLAAPLTLDHVLALATERSEAARAARAGVRSATEAARAAGQLPDPTLSVGIDNLPVTGRDRFSSTRDAMTMKRIAIAQEWVSAEKRSARQAAGEALRGREAVAAQVAVAEVRLRAALAYLDAFFAQEALRLTALSEHHAHEEIEAAKGRLASSVGSGQEVLALTGARGTAEDESAEVRQQQGAAQVALGRWVGVQPVEVAAPPVLTTVDEQRFVADHPAVLAARSDVDVARQDAAVAAADRRPNWSWELAYGQRTGYSDMVSFGVSIPLPVAPAQRQDREVASRQALIDKAEASLAEATRAATAEFLTLAGDARRLAERMQRYQALVVAPAHQRTVAALAAYRSNQGPLTTLFEARHMEVAAQRKLLALRRELAQTQAQLAFKPLALGDTP